jgi:hypothetical protein
MDDGQGTDPGGPGAIERALRTERAYFAATLERLRGALLAAPPANADQSLASLVALLTMAATACTKFRGLGYDPDSIEDVTWAGYNAMLERVVQIPRAGRD